MKILENLKTLSEGREVTLESFLQSEQKNVVSGSTLYRPAPSRIITTTTSQTPNQAQVKRLIPRGDGNFGLKRTTTTTGGNNQQEGDYASPDRVEPQRIVAPPPPEKDPTRIELRLKQDQHNQTSQMNVNGS